MILETERCKLRFFKSSDVDALFSICNDKEFNQYIPLPYPYHKSDAKKWIKLQSQKRESGLGFDYAVVLKADNKLIGSVSIEIDKKNQFGELGCWISKQCWGNGFATESLKRLTSFAFEDLGLHKVYAKCYKENIASLRAIQKCGLTFVGTLKEHSLKDGKFHDCLLYELINKN